MKTFLIALVAVVGLTIVNVGTAQASARGWRRRARVTYVPAPTATVAQGQAGAGYRTYSYQPGMYQPAAGYRSYSRSPASGFRDAGAKIRGEY